MAAALVIFMAAPAADVAWVAETSRPSVKASATGRRGRPRKFNRPSRAVTLTLPEDVVATLHAIDVDLSRAVVRAVQGRGPEAPGSPAELTRFGDSAIIVVPPNSTLKKRAGVEFVPLPDGRALISFDERLSISEIELRLRDALADPAFDLQDRPVFEALADILGAARRADGVSLRQRSIIVVHGLKAADSQTTSA
jgi:hypothetical protein